MNIFNNQQQQPFQFQQQSQPAQPFSQPIMTQQQPFFNQQTAQDPNTQQLLAHCEKLDYLIKNLNSKLEGLSSQQKQILQFTNYRAKEFQQAGIFDQEQGQNLINNDNFKEQIQGLGKKMIDLRERNMFLTNKYLEVNDMIEVLCQSNGAMVSKDPIEEMRQSQILQDVEEQLYFNGQKIDQLKQRVQQHQTVQPTTFSKAQTGDVAKKSELIMQIMNIMKDGLKIIKQKSDRDLADFNILTQNNGY